MNKVTVAIVSAATVAIVAVAHRKGWLPEGASSVIDKSTDATIDTGKTIFSKMKSVFKKSAVVVSETAEAVKEKADDVAEHVAPEAANASSAAEPEAAAAA